MKMVWMACGVGLMSWTASAQTADLFVEVVSINGADVSDGEVGNHLVEEGDRLVMEVRGEGPKDNIIGLVLRLEPVGDLGAAENLSINPALGEFLPNSGVFEGNGVNAQGFRFPGGAPFLLPDWLFRFEFVVGDEVGSFRYDQLRDPVDGPENALRSIAFDYAIRVIESDRVFTNPEPGTNTCSGDFDNDGDVDLGDLGFFGTVFNTSEGDPRFDAAADFNGDGDIDLGDFGAFGRDFFRQDCLLTP